MSRISVVIPVYNGSEFLEATLANVLASDADDFEVVVLDNASTDATPDILRRVTDPRVRVERNDTLLALPDNWQRATELASGEFLKVVCADDLIRKDALRIQADALAADPSLALVAARRHFIDDDGLVLSYDQGLPFLTGRRSAAQLARRITWLGINPLGESAAVMFRRRDFEAVGGWNGALTYPMDADLWLRLLSRGDLLGQPETLAAFRISRGSLSSRHDQTQLGEQSSFIHSVAEDPSWKLSRTARATSPQIVRLGWLAWTLRDRLWRSRLLGPARPLGAPRPLRRRLLLPSPVRAHRLGQSRRRP